MYHHIKKLMYTVNVGTPDPRFGNMLLEQFGGANGELAAAMQYSIQGLNCEDPDRKDMLMDIGTEELALSVSMAKRMREVLCGLPSLLSWQWMEGRRLRAVAGSDLSIQWAMPGPPTI